MMRQRAKQAWYEVRRLWWALAIAVVGIVATSELAETSKVALLTYKLSLLTVLWIVWHLLRSQTFPYLDFGSILQAGGSRAVAAAIVLGATAIAVILGGMLGL